jgi:hypothetical protein
MAYPTISKVDSLGEHFFTQGQIELQAFRLSDSALNVSMTCTFTALWVESVIASTKPYADALGARLLRWGGMP